MWIVVLAEPDAFGILIWPAMRDGEPRFTGEATIAGESVRLRQTWLRRDEFSVEIVNERYTENRWRRWDSAFLKRHSPPN